MSEKIPFLDMFPFCSSRLFSGVGLDLAVWCFLLI